MSTSAVELKEAYKPDNIRLYSVVGYPAINRKNGYFCNLDDVWEDDIKHGTKEWDKIYKKLKPKDKKTVDDILSNISVNEVEDGDMFSFTDLVKGPKILIYTGVINGK